MTTSIPSQYRPDLQTIASLRQGDKLAVREGKLVITRAGFTQGIVRTVKDFIYGGYNREAVLEHCRTVLQNLPQTPRSRDIPNDDLILIDRVKDAFFNLSLTYNDRSPHRNEFSILRENIPTVIPHYSYHDLCKAEPHLIKSMSLSELSLEDTNRLVAHINKQRVPTWKKVAAYISSFHFLY